MKVVVWLENEIRAFSVQAEQLARLRQRHPSLTFCVARDEQAFLKELADADAALIWRFSAAWYGAAPKLRFVATPAAGREKLEPDAERRVRALHGHFHGQIMAESLLAMVLFFSRRLDLAVEARRAGRYEREAYSTTRRLAGQTALIIGYGPLGRSCAKLLKAFGLRVVGVKRNADVDPAPADAVFPSERLPELLPEADLVILTLPGDTGARHLIGERELASLRSSASLYNLGRGNAVDEAALLRALRAGQLAHAFLDVFEREPLPLDSPLWSEPKLAFLPHASAISAEYLDLWFEELAGELDALAR
ncbi:MAG TPA: D-2-hydroxyacid dehydrogenase [Polyangiaceae bacterium]|nr:D-2-hydroxyacid dehydrogenase [Polyangiaceae bacterium]